MDIYVFWHNLLPAGNPVRFPCGSQAVSRPPAVFIDPAVAAGLEILDVVMTGFIRMIEGIRETGSFKRRLRNAVYRFWRGYAGHLIHGRGYIVHVRELTAQAADVLNPRRPGDNQGVSCAAQM